MGGKTPIFNLSRGIRQECPTSLCVFLLVAKLVAVHITASVVKDLLLVENESLLSWQMQLNYSCKIKSLSVTFQSCYSK